jgi:hypothetical protein
VNHEAFEVDDGFVDAFVSPVDQLG